MYSIKTNYGTTGCVWLENLTIKNKNMTPREFRQEQDFEFDHFSKLTSTGISPDYVNIELFAHEYHKRKLNLLNIPVVSKTK